MKENPSENPGAWLLPASGAKELRPGLYIIATPIGNLSDITLRALDTLAGADIVACEDTRVSGKLLTHYGLKKSLLSYNDHNADARRGGIVEKIRAGARVALISDAGTPLISDPGYKLSRVCAAEGLYVTALPGANAVLTGLQLSVLPTDSFSFIGFLPAKSAARKKELARWKNAPGTLIAFETAPRLSASLRDILETLGDREGAVVREMTKLYEESRRAKISELIAYYESAGAPKGEIVLAIGAADEDEETVDVESALKKALKTMSVKEASAHVAALSGRPKREMYEMALEMNHASRK